MSDYWDNQLRGFNGGVSMIGNALARRGLYNQMMQARAPLYNAEADEAMRRGRLLDSENELTQGKVQELAQKGAMVETLQKKSAAALQALREKRFDDPDLADYINATSSLTGVNKGDIAKSMKENLGTIEAMSGNVDTAAGVQDPVAVERAQIAAGERAARPVTVPTGSTLMSPAGDVLGQGGVTLQPGATRFGPVTGTNAPTQQAQGQKMPPKSSAVRGAMASAIARVLENPNMRDKDKVTAISGIRSYLGSLDTDGSEPAQPQPGAAPQPAAAPAPAAPAKVRVKNPQGQFGYIPADQLEDAQRQGYELAQ